MNSPKSTVLITGGTKGLGLATARAMATKDTRLLLTYRSDETGATKAAEELGRVAGECHVIPVDLTDPAAPEHLFQRVTAFTDGISVYVHNAAATVFKPLLDIAPHHMEKTFNLSVFSFVRNMQQLVPLMPRGGAVVTVSGMDTLEAVPAHGLLAAAKASLEMLTRYFAHELAPRNIRVNGVNPGFLPTDSTRKYLGAQWDVATKALAAATPGRAIAKLEDVASVIAFLASEKARWIVGETLVVDGGWTFASPAFSLLAAAPQKEKP